MTSHAEMSTADTTQKMIAMREKALCHLVRALSATGYATAHKTAAITIATQTKATGGISVREIMTALMVSSAALGPSVQFNGTACALGC